MALASTSSTLAAVAGAAAALGVALWVRSQRRHPSPFPYAQRWLLLPLPYLSVARLRRLLEPRPGERLLEVGAGTGRHAIPVAAALRPNGSLEALDVQREMVDHLARRAGERGLENVTATEADAHRLPYGDDTFDGAYLITVLGEIPDQAAALRELFRVLKPNGRLVVGESPLDPHVVSLRALRARAEAAGFRFDRRLGPPALGYLARFSKPAPSG